MEASVAVLGALLEGVMATGQLLYAQEGDRLREFFFVFLTVLGRCLGRHSSLQEMQTTR